MIDTAPRREEQAFAMNRETKRAMARQQKTADPQRLQQLRKQQLERQRDRPWRRPAGRPPVAAAWRRLVRQRGRGRAQEGELARPAHGGRYTVVVLVAVSVITAIIFGLDSLFGRAVFAVFGD
jgi:hypothetical protein